MKQKQINQNWKEFKLGKICDVRDGTHDSPKYSNEGFPLITSKNLTKGYVDFSVSARFSFHNDHVLSAANQSSSARFYHLHFVSTYLAKVYLSFLSHILHPISFSRLFSSFRTKLQSSFVHDHKLDIS